MKFIPYIPAAAIVFAAVISMAGCEKNKSTESGAPAAPTITGETANVCPVAAVALTATAQGATSYAWYRNAYKIDGASAATYAATSSATYYAAGINQAGEGEKSAGHAVTVTLNCPPGTPAISGAAVNACPDAKVTLTANAANAESYEWYKGAAKINGATAQLYEATEAATYYAIAINSSGRSEKSEGHTITIIPCPPGAPAITGATNNTCPGKTVVLTANAAAATSYQWYLYNQPIAGATNTTYTVTTTGAYYASGVNTLGEGAKNANAYMVFIDVCFDGFNYTDLLGNYTAGGTPGYYCCIANPVEPGPSSWTAAITAATVTDPQFQYAYSIAPFADFWLAGAQPPFYVSAYHNTTSGMVAFLVNQKLPLGFFEHNGADYTAYFELTFRYNDTQYVFFSDDYIQTFWDVNTNTLDFSGVYTYQGKDYELLAGIMGRRNDDRQWGGSMSELYKNCRYVKNGAAGAGALTGEKVPGIPRLGQHTAAAPEAIYIDFDPTKFKRK